MSEKTFRHIFLQNGEMYNFVCNLIISQNFSYIAHGFPEIITFPVQLPLKPKEESLYCFTQRMLLS